MLFFVEKFAKQIDIFNFLKTPEDHEVHLLWNGNVIKKVFTLGPSGPQRSIWMYGMFLFAEGQALGQVDWKELWHGKCSLWRGHFRFQKRLKYKEKGHNLTYDFILFPFFKILFSQVIYIFPDRYINIRLAIIVDLMSHSVTAILAILTNLAFLNIANKMVDIGL